MDRDWAELEVLALGLILDKLVERIDQVWFGAVCKNWCSVAKFNHQNQQFRSNVLPMLMIPTESKSRTHRSLYGIPSNRVYHFQLPVPYQGRCHGSSHGWLATVDYTYVITLHNPFKDVAPIQLPPIDINTRNFQPPIKINTTVPMSIRRHNKPKVKVILSADPITSPNDYVAVALHSRFNILAIIKAGQKFWTYVHNYHHFTDVAFYKGLVYAVSKRDDIISFDLCYSKDPSGSEKIIPKIVYANENNDPLPTYLLESSDTEFIYPIGAYVVKSLEGDLWFVKRFISNRGGTKKFEVYKLELDAQNGMLLSKLKLDSLGDNVLFLGDSESISVSTSYFSNRLQKDSIYFTDDNYDDIPISHHRGSFDMGIYNVKDERISEHYPCTPSFRCMPRPIWVLPPFKWD